MKTLYLLRHGKSDLNEKLVDDERTLSSRGVHNIISLGNYIKQRRIEPDTVFISPTVRTRETFIILKKKKNKFKNVLFTDELYDKTGKELFPFLKGLDNKLNSVMLIGHNPGLEELATYLIGENVFPKFPTSALLQLDFSKANWDSIENGDGKIRIFWIP